MANPKSYAWSQQLSAVVAVGEEAEVNTPGIVTAEDYKTDEVEVVHQGQVLLPEQFEAVWEEDWTHIHITNNTANDWQPGETIYVTLSGIPFDPADIEQSFTALDARVATVEGQVDDLETRVAALEGVPPASRAAAAADEHADDEGNGDEPKAKVTRASVTRATPSPAKRAARKKRR